MISPESPEAAPDEKGISGRSHSLVSCCSCLVWLIQQLDFEFALVHGLTVPYSVKMTLAIQKMLEQDRFLTYVSSFQAVVALYTST